MLVEVKCKARDEFKVQVALGMVERAARILKTARANLARAGVDESQLSYIEDAEELIEMFQQAEHVGL